METKSSKQFGVSATSLLDKYRTDLFFRTTCHIIVLQILLTAIIIAGLWYVVEYLVRDTGETLISTFTQMLQGQNITGNNVREQLQDIQTDQFWPAMVVATTFMLCFGFIMVYVALTPTRRSLERKKRFVSNIAHELRTPLAIIRTNTDVALLNKELSPKIRDTLERNNFELARISEIINNLLSLSNFMRDKQMQFEDVNLSVIAQQAMDTLAETIEHKDITLSLKSHTNQTVIGNASALEQVVYNLVKNAIAHTKSKGHITIEIEPANDGKFINLLVSDTGNGIARKDLFHIFEPFYRARKAPKNGGQGLGLAIVNEIMQIHRGKIKIQSAEGKGTTVIVSIKRSVQEKVSYEAKENNNLEEVTMDFSHRIID